MFVNPSSFAALLALMITGQSFPLSEANNFRTQSRRETEAYFCLTASMSSTSGWSTQQPVINPDIMYPRSLTQSISSNDVGGTIKVCFYTNPGSAGTLTGSVTGLPTDHGLSAALHTGTSCDTLNQSTPSDPAGEFYIDPPTSTTFLATPVGDTGTEFRYSQGYGYSATIGRLALIVDNNLQMVGCGILQEMPSSMPSEQPSGQPSSMPSGQPSGQPSSSASEQPSSIPSEQPSGQPSSIPSEQPSGQPSSSPSEQPSSIPSEQPTGQPSETPSTQPSCTPSLAPTASGTIHLFYPEWTRDPGGCLNDGNHPSYMAANPAGYLFSTKASCCTTHYGWNYQFCVGGGPGTCARALFYPNWAGSDLGCIDDGKEPAYMTNNADSYMYATLAECCKERYLWNYNDCVGTRTSNTGMYYPAFSSADHVCRNDGGQPQYMNDSPSHWLHVKLADCCNTNYRWNYMNCVGTPGATSPATSPITASTPTTTITNTGPKWYPDWSGANKSCKGDGAQPEYMTKNPTQWLYASKQICCKTRYSWSIPDCMAS